MNLGLEGKVALSTGSSKGIGRSIGLCFAAEGCNVSLSARGNSKLRETEREVAELGVETQATVGDLTTANGIEKVVGETLERWGKIDILVNNVGGSIWNSFVDVTDEEWLDIFNLNMSYPLMCCKFTFFPHSGEYMGHEGPTSTNLFNQTKRKIRNFWKRMS